MRTVVTRAVLAHGIAFALSGAAYAGLIHGHQDPVVALAAATIVAGGTRFLSHKLWVFDDRGWARTPGQVGKSLLLEAVVFCANAVALYFAVRFAHWNAYLTQAAFAVILSASNFLVSRRSIFFRHIPVQTRAP